MFKNKKLPTLATVAGSRDAKPSCFMNDIDKIWTKFSQIARLFFTRAWSKKFRKHKDIARDLGGWDNLRRFKQIQTNEKIFSSSFPQLH